MNHTLTQLAERREHLLALIAAQRTALAQDMATWHAPLALADHGVAALRYIRRHPALSMGGILVIAALRPHHAGKWMMRAWLLWQLGRKFIRN